MSQNISKNKVICIFCFCLLSVITIYGCLLYSIQEKLIYFPDKEHIAPQGQLSVFQENIIPADDGTPIMTWFSAGESDKPAILFFHGNSGQIAKFATNLLPFTNRGYTVLMMEYRGFGNNPGEIGQQNFYKDTLKVFDWLQQNYPEIIVYGYSLGTTMAINVASNRPANKLILTAPFASMKKLVGEKNVPLATLVLKDEYDSESMMKKINIPTLIIHGKQDKLIPYHHAENLFEVSPSQDKDLRLTDRDSHSSIFFYESNIPIIFDWLEHH